MKILLIGEYSGLHWTLAEGLRLLGHEVTVVSDGDLWKNYPRDINLFRPTDSFTDGLRYLWKVLHHLPKFKGYDVVQLINPHFLRLRSERTLPIYRYLKKHNKRIFLGAFGHDYYYTHACMESNIYRYSDYKVGNRYKDTENNRIALQEDLHGGTAVANKEIANSCDGIIACLWEYYAAYQLHFPKKSVFIPLPIDLRNIAPRTRTIPQKVNFFIGIQSKRSDVKGTDIMLPILRDIAQKYPDRCTVTEVSNVPFATYCQLLDKADVQLDQIYSYTPSMNSLLAMAKGVVVISGGEPENYAILNEQKLRPIINVQPCESDIYKQLEETVLHPERIPQLSTESIEYVKKHHDMMKVAQQYIDYWSSIKK